MNVKLINVTPDAEKIIAYTARVSSPNQENPEIEKLLKYCIKNSHWSIYEMADLTVEIETTRGLAPQILRHWSFHIQEFSQRYAEVQGYEIWQGRRQDIKNRQKSIDDMSVDDQSWFMESQKLLNEMANNMYQEALKKGFAKESARVFTTSGTKTKLYFKGTIRDFIHYINVRTDGNTVQKEHQDIANEIKKIFIKELPIIAKALDWE